MSEMRPDLNAATAVEPPDDAERLRERCANACGRDALEGNDERRAGDHVGQLHAWRHCTRACGSPYPIEHLRAAMQRAAAKVPAWKMRDYRFIEEGQERGRIARQKALVRCPKVFSGDGHGVRRTHG